MHWLPVAALLTTLTIASPLERRLTCPQQVVRDRSFESGITPPTSGGPDWNVDGFIGSTSYNLSSPGSSISGGGKYAYTALLYPGPYSNGQSSERLFQTLNTCVGQNYSIQADIKFNSSANNLCSVKVTYPVRNIIGSITTYSATPGIQPGKWYQTGSFFQAVSNTSLLSI